MPDERDFWEWAVSSISHKHPHLLFTWQRSSCQTCRIYLNFLLFLPGLIFYLARWGDRLSRRGLVPSLARWRISISVTIQSGRVRPLERNRSCPLACPWILINVLPTWHGEAIQPVFRISSRFENYHHCLGTKHPIIGNIKINQHFSIEGQDRKVPLIFLYWYKIWIFSFFSSIS